jgi:hypothetical protein
MQQLRRIRIMSSSSSSIRRFVRRTLVDATGVPSPDHAHLASAFDTLCDRLRRHLQPLFGTAAVTALFLRSVRVATSEFPWLGQIVSTEEACSAAQITTLGRLDMGTLEEGLAAVLAHNIGLLSAFVGEDLTLPLVQQAWGIDDAAGSKVIE